MKEHFKIKICGVTTRTDAQIAVDAGADAIGLNFYAKSPRSLSREKAVELAIPQSVKKVGVFVNHSIQEIHRIVDTCSLDIVQLHGDETPSWAIDLQEYWLMPVLRIQKSNRLEGICERAGEWLGSGARIAAILLDAQVGESYGGTGHVLDWELASQVVAKLSVPVVLAGGLNPSNVASAIQQVQPSAVDVASGVEECKGKKNADDVKAFVSSAATAFSSMT